MRWFGGVDFPAFFTFDSLALGPERGVPGQDDLLNVRLFKFKLQNVVQHSDNSLALGA